MAKEFRRIGSLLLALIMLTGIAALWTARAETAAAEPERVEVKADFEGAWVKLANHLLKIFLPEGWEMSSGEEGALMAARDPESDNSLRVEELRLPGVTLEGVMEAFRADSEMRGVQEVYINDLRLVRYESPQGDVLGFVSTTGYSDRVLLFKFEPASDKEFAELAVRVMSTLTRVAKAGARKTAATPKPAATPIPGIQTWAELLKAAKAGKKLVLVGANLKRGAKQATAVFKSAVTIKSATGKQYVVDGNGKQAVRVEKADGGKVEGTTEIVGLKFVNGDAGAYNYDLNTGMGGAVYVNGDLSVTDSAFSGNTADYGGAVMATGDISLTDTDITGNTANLNGGGVYTEYGEVTVTGGSVSGNSAVNGGGIFTYIDVTIDGADITENTAENLGGGVFTYGNVTISGDSAISGNSAKTGGGIYSVEATITGGSITGNDASDAGGGICAVVVTVDGGSITGNDAGVTGGGIASLDVTVNGGVIEGNSPNDIGF